MTVNSHPFHVVLGLDYAGKTSLVRWITKQFDWKAISLDDALLDEPTRSLMAAFRKQVVPNSQRYSGAFVCSWVQTLMYYFRDAVTRERAHGPIIADSYYYKLPVKCGLKGHVCRDIAVPSEPRPEKVLFLKIDPELAFERALQTNAQINEFEYHGSICNRDSFVRFQSELEEAMLRAVGDIPVVTIDATAPVETVRSDAARALGCLL